jgi:hypothetical protein
MGTVSWTHEFSIKSKNCTDSHPGLPRAPDESVTEENGSATNFFDFEGFDNSRKDPGCQQKISGGRLDMVTRRISDRRGWVK